MAPAVCTADWSPTRADLGAAERFTQEACRRPDSTCGPGRMGSFREEGTTGFEVQDLDFHGRGLHGEGASRSSKFHSMESLLQGLHNSHADVEGERTCTLARLRAVHRESMRMTMDIEAGRPTPYTMWQGLGNQSTSCYHRR